MSNLTSAQTGAFDAMLELLGTAGAAHEPAIAVLDTAVESYEPSSGYVLMEALEQHEFNIAALGSFAFYEVFYICGHTQYAQGITTNADWKTIRDQTFAIHQAVVQATIVANRGANQTPILGPQAPVELQYIVPTFQRYTPQATDKAGLMVGDIEWRFQLKARITVP